MILSLLPGSCGVVVLVSVSVLVLVLVVTLEALAAEVGFADNVGKNDA